MTFGMISDYAQGTVLVVPFPFSDPKGSKTRPALVLAEVGDDIIACAITGTIRPRRYCVILTKNALREAGLRHESAVKVSALVTLHKNLVQSNLGCVDAETFERVRDEFRALV